MNVGIKIYPALIGLSINISTQHRYEKGEVAGQLKNPRRDSYILRRGTTPLRVDGEANTLLTK
jgi:hypothetical protein